MTALISYNTAPRYLQDIVKQTPSLKIYENIFNPKQSKNVKPTDPVWQRLWEDQPLLDRMIIFAGKKSSGACDIINMFHKRLPPEKLFFVLCDHDLKEKEKILTDHGFQKDIHYGVFSDSHHQCRE